MSECLYLDSSDLITPRFVDKLSNNNRSMPGGPVLNDNPIYFEDLVDRHRKLIIQMIIIRMIINNCS